MSETKVPESLTENLPEGVKRKPYSSMGLIAFACVAATVEDYDRIGGRIGLCLEDACDNQVYRGQLNTFRTEVCKLVETETGIERKKKVTNQKAVDEVQARIDAGEDVQPLAPEYEYLETDAKYFKRVCEEEGVEPDHFQHLAEQASAALVFEPQGRERTGPKPKTPTKAAYAVADKVLADGKQENLAAFLTEQLGTAIELTGDNDTDRETLAQGVHANELREQREAAKRREAAYLQV